MVRITDLENRLNRFSQTDSSVQKISEVKEKKQSDVLGFCVISYAVNKTDLSDLPRNLIDNDVFKSYLKADNRKVFLESFTDKSSSAAYKKKLSDLRLKRAVQFLLVLGVKPNDIITNSYGDSKSSDEVNPEEKRLVIKIVENGK